MNDGGRCVEKMHQKKVIITAKNIKGSAIDHETVEILSTAAQYCANIALEKACNR